MAFVISKISDQGTSSDAVARLCLQTSELVNAMGLDKKQRDDLLGLYFKSLLPRLQKCEEIIAKIAGHVDAAERQFLEPHEGTAIRLDQVPSLREEAEPYLYNAKNFLRDLIVALNILFGCKLEKASDFAAFGKASESAMAAWAKSTFGEDDDLARMLKMDQGWATLVCRYRNAAEHPKGHSGHLTVENLSFKEGVAYRPAWFVNDEEPQDILHQMTEINNALLTLAEDIIAHGIRLISPCRGMVKVAEIPREQRNPAAPVRLCLILAAPLPPPTNA